MSNTAIKSVDKLLEAINDRRFSPYLFGVSISEESEVVNDVFFKIILSYLEVMAKRHDFGITAYGNTYIQAQASAMLGGIGIDLNPFDT
jgi:hypothetical protein